jgi:DNA invertase Pin-like site-specific DNA recombinase
LYARISEDDTGEGRGVARQLDLGKALAASRGWTVVAEHIENDISAWSGRRRPAYESLMAQVDAREIDVIVVYQSSRLWRSRKERAGGIERLMAARVGVAAVDGPDLDLSTANGRMIAGILGEFDTAESEVKSERVARAAEQRAQEGRPSGDLGYGWDRVVDVADDGRTTTTYVVNETEATVVREAVSRVLAGEGFRSITDDLNRRGIPAPGADHRRRRRVGNEDGQLWGRSTLRKLVLRPSNAALRLHRGTVIGAATWPPLIDRDTYDAVVVKLRDPARQSNGGAHLRRHLLTGSVGECGVCSGPLRVHRTGGNVIYSCERSACVGRNQAKVDDLVERVVLRRLVRPDAVELLTPPTTDADLVELLAQRDNVRDRLGQAADAFAEGKIDADQLARITARLRPELDAVEADVRRAGAPARDGEMTRLVGNPDAAQVWNGLDVVRQHAALAALGLRVRIMPTRRGPGFREDDVVIDWAGNTRH